MTAQRFSNDICIWYNLNEIFPKQTEETHFDNFSFVRANIVYFNWRKKNTNDKWKVCNLEYLYKLLFENINFKINVKWAHVSQGSFRGKKKRWYLHLVIISFFWKLQDLKCHCFFYTSWPMGYFIRLWWITCHPSGHVPDVTNLRSKYLELNGLLDCFDLNKARRPSEAFWRKEYTNFETLRKLELLN